MLLFPAPSIVLMRGMAAAQCERGLGIAPGEPTVWRPMLEIMVGEHKLKEIIKLCGCVIAICPTGCAHCDEH